MRKPLLIAALLALATFRPASAEVWTRSYDLTGRPVVRVATDDAHVRVHTRPSGPVEFRVEYEVHKMGFVSMSRKQPQVEFEQNGNTIALTVREPRFVAVFATVETRYSIDVTVPEETDVQVRTGDGAIDCEPLKGSTTLETGDGSINATGLSGTTWVRTGDGSVDMFDVTGSFTARSGDGHVRADGRFDRLDVATGDGRVEIVARPGSKPTQAWSLETRDGSLKLRIPRDFAAFLDARTNDGRLRVDLPIRTDGRSIGRSLSGELNGGGPPLRLRTGDGSLTIALSE